MTVESNTRELESEIVTDLKEKLTYGSYLQLDQVLSAQQPLSSPEHHDEMLFIIQHQTTELWLKLLLHELWAGCAALAADDLGDALKKIARIKHIQRSMIEQWSVLATLTPTEYAQFRGTLANSSGFQSAQYRAVEFLLGNKNAKMLRVFEGEPENAAMLTDALEAPSLYDQFLRYLARHGHAVPQRLLDRDVTVAHIFDDELCDVLTAIYENAEEHWEEYEACEELVDLEDSFQLWRFRHLRTVQRTIGMKRGTGGSSGVGFLQKALELTFFPELFEVRTRIGQP
ncbi:MAG: tryptophan 2,3-dioxygenase [Microbacterium sp. 67-17]|uniref:tryptophan 2,3-dioxygenase n=1 Tax=Microbacterium sp. 67-17 TaxID=1895782 RepID=UPI00095B793C|nr:tryptophan 2,3-dioxygenase family protein [Microbacterium sp. 67-17]OJV93567.1 MAG: tryptophan 2,3-dioxygenase [Microbacterium sp. 67-17]